MTLQDKVALVTGGSRGIGAATVRELASRGAAVAIIDVDVEAAQALADELKSNDHRALAVQANVASLDEAKVAVERVHKEWGSIDVLVNNAGIVRDAQLVKMTEEEFDSVIAVNLKGTFNFTQAVAPIMIEQASGSIINVSSVVALYGNFGQTNYVATKAGVIGMTKVWARELGRKGIRVNAVCPGFIATEMVEQIPDKIVEKMKSQVPSHQLGKPEEVARVYAFLASDDASYVNGAVLSVDGGMSL